jgi:hypothetical protein
MYKLVQKKLKENKIWEMISYLEKLLEKIPKNPFHSLIWINFNDNINWFNKIIDELINLNEEIDYFYMEINWFTINYWWDLYVIWHEWEWWNEFDLSGDNSDLDDHEICDDTLDLLFWKTEEENNYFTSIFSKYSDLEYECLLLKESSEICELLVILRLNEFVRKSVKTKKTNKNIPIYLNAHDYEFDNKIIY